MFKKIDEVAKEYNIVSQSIHYYMRMGELKFINVEYIIEKERANDIKEKIINRKYIDLSDKKTLKKLKELSNGNNIKSKDKK